MTKLVQNFSPAGSRRGRPRSVERHQAILEVTRALLAAGGYEQLTMEAIAAGAGVSKPTIYKWWPSKAAVVTEAVMAGYVVRPSAPAEDTGDIADDLGAWLNARFEEAADPAVNALTRAMVSATAEGDDTDIDRHFRLLAEPTRQALLRRLEAAVAKGQIRRDADIEAAVDVVVSMLMFKALTPRPTNARTGADGLLDLLLRGLVHQSEPRRSHGARS